MKHARELAAAIIKKAYASVDTASQIAFDPARSRLVVVWPAVDVDDKITLRRLAVPQATTDAYTLDMPGIGTLDRTPGLYEVFIAADERSSLVSIYTSTRTENPILAQIVDVAGRVITPLFGLASGVAGEVARAAATAGAPAPSATTPLFVTSSRLVLPWQRAHVSVKSQAQVPATTDRLKTAVDRIVANVELKELGRSQWARKYADARGKRTVETAASCITGTLSADACSHRFDADFTSVFDACVTQKKCMPGATATDDDKSGFAKVDETIRDFVSTGIASSVTAESTFANTPLTHFGFGLTTALVLEGWPSKVRVKLDDDGNVVADPLGRQVSMIVLNWSPAGYRESDPSPSKAERARLFLGAVITPDFGIGVGGSLLLVRGLAVNAGVGVLFSRGVANPDALRSAPTDPKKPFELSYTPFTFIGASFNFK